jgi:hypothetical protein
MPDIVAACSPLVVPTPGEHTVEDSHLSGNMLRARLLAANANRLHFFNLRFHGIPTACNSAATAN